MTAREKAETAIRGWHDMAMKSMSQHVPSILPADAASSTTVSVEWLAWMLSFAYCEGTLSGAAPGIDLMDLMKDSEMRGAE